MTDTSKILLTQVLTFVLTPMSIALTLYFIQRNRAPRPDLQYVSVTPYYTVAEPSSELVKKIDNDSYLSSEFRRELRQASFSMSNPEVCTAWLDGGAWDGDCMGVYKSVINQVRGELKGIAEQGHGSVQETKAGNSLRILEALRKEWATLENAKQSRTGSVLLTVGVLNGGDSDGTIFRDGLLKFNNQVMQVSADKYIPVGAHGFSEIAFTTAREEGGETWGAYRTGDERIIKVWSDLVKAGNEIPFELTITLSNKSEVAKGTVPNEGN